MKIEATKYILRTSRTSHSSTVATTIETYDNIQREPLQCDEIWTQSGHRNPSHHHVP